MQTKKIALILVAIAIGAVVGVVIYTAQSSVTLPVQLYSFQLAPQSIINISKVYYVLDGQHGLIIQVSADTHVVIANVSSDARTWTVGGDVTIPNTPTWIMIPGWNCGYSDGNGRMQDTKIVTSAGNVLDLTYPCIYPPTSTQVQFQALVRPSWSDGMGYTYH